MLTILGWSLATLFGIILAWMQWSWRKHAIELVIQSEFISVMFVDRATYENYRKSYMDWVDGWPSDVSIGHWRMACDEARNMAIHHIGNLGGTVGLLKVLTNYKSSQTG